MSSAISAVGGSDTLNSLAGIGSNIIGGLSAQNVAKTQEAASKYATNVGASLAREQMAMDQASKDAASEQLAGATTNVQNTLSSSPEELAALQADIESGNTKALQDLSKQTSANLATSGVRGGQAATLQNRAVGEAATTAQKDIDELLAEDATSRQKQLAGYYSNLGTTSSSRT